MKGIKINVSNNIAQITEKPQRIIAGTVGLPVEFTFDNHWDGLVKYAVFHAGGKPMMSDEIETSTTVPWEVLQIPNQQLMIGVYGENADGTEALPTVWVNAGVIRFGALPRPFPGIPSPAPVWQKLKNEIINMWNWLTATIGNLDELNTENKETIVDAINEVAGSKEVFAAEYEATPIEDIVDAHNAGKAIVCKHGALLLPMVQRVGYNATFSGIDDLGNLHTIVNKKDVWSHTTEDMVMESDTILVVNRDNSVSGLAFDKTYEEVYAAHEAGRTILLRSGYQIYYCAALASVNGSRYFVFRPFVVAYANAATQTYKWLKLTEDNTWSENDTGFELMTEAKVKTLIEENAPEGITEERVNELVDEKVSDGIPGAKPMVYFELDVVIGDYGYLKFDPEQIQTVIDNGMTIVIKATEFASGVIHTRERRFIMKKDAMYLATPSGIAYYYSQSVGVSGTPLTMKLDQDAFANGDEIIQEVTWQINNMDLLGAYAVSV